MKQAVEAETTPETILETIAPRVWSEQQCDIFSWGAGDEDNDALAVIARAGTGKTTTAIEMVSYMPEDFVLMTAFSRQNADDLTSKLSRVKQGAKAMTVHGLGLRYVGRRYRGIQIVKGNARARWVVQQVKPNLPYGVELEVAGLFTLLREIKPFGVTQEEALTIMDRFGFALDAGFKHKYSDDDVALWARSALQWAATREPDRKVGIDFADMLFLSLVQDLLSKDYPAVIVDEAQDLTLAQLEMMKRVCSGRMCIIGDPRQAIFGFRGAEPGGMMKLVEELGADIKYLTTTYRCGHEIVKNAQRLVPDIVAHESNHEGVVEQDEDGSLMLSEAKAGDFIISRINAPCVRLCLRFLGQQKRAVVKGRDISDQILKLLKKLNAQPSWSINYLLDRLAEYRAERVTAMLARDDQDGAERLKDNIECLTAIASESTDMADLQRRCDYLFARDDDDFSQVIMLSSIHKAKGLETDTVWVLNDTLYRFGRDLEEENLEYVAITRAKKRLVLVDRMGLSEKQRVAKAAKLGFGDQLEKDETR